VNTPANLRFLRGHETLIAEVSQIRRDKNGCFRWTVTDEHNSIAYRTSARGDGIWQRIFNCPCSYGCDLCGAGTGWKQILGGGTSQFDLADITASTRRRRVVRRFAVDSC
jgi:hypothetical protein